MFLSVLHVVVFLYIFVSIVTVLEINVNRMCSYLQSTFNNEYSKCVT